MRTFDENGAQVKDDIGCMMLVEDHLEAVKKKDKKFSLVEFKLSDKVDEWKHISDNWKEKSRKKDEQIAALAAENARLREALEKIVERAGRVFVTETDTIVLHAVWMIAQAAIKTEYKGLPSTELREGRPPAFTTACDCINCKREPAEPDSQYGYDVHGNVVPSISRKCVGQTKGGEE
jgi:hypothetical protein